MRCGGATERITASAATASGGASSAPSAIAAAHGMFGRKTRETQATAMVVSPTATSTSDSTGRQFARRSRSDVSCAASSRTGATNSARISSGGRPSRGTPGIRATATPPTASSVG